MEKFLMARVLVLLLTGSHLLILYLVVLKMVVNITMAFINTITMLLVTTAAAIVFVITALWWALLLPNLFLVVEEVGIEAAKLVV